MLREEIERILVVGIPNPVESVEVIAAFPEFDIDPKPLGFGGMKSAFQILGDDLRVLKVVHEALPEEASEGAISLPERIRREIEGMRAISHPGIVSIVSGPDVRVIGDGPRVWYIEPLFAGGTLADQMTGRWPETKCLGLLDGLVNAAEALASHNVVHRDIKPENIVFNECNEPILLDLGIAYFQDLTPLTDNWGQSPMTPMHAAPEQFDMRIRTSIDFRTDLFLIGIVIFEVLTGVHPFNPEDSEGYFERLINGHWNGNALNNVDISSGFRRILCRLLDPARSRRYRRFEHLRKAIEEC